MRKKLDPVIIIVTVLALGIFATAATKATSERDIQTEDVPALQRGVYLNSNG